MADTDAVIASESTFAWRTPAAISQRVPWLWHDLVVVRSGLPLWMLSAFVFLALYGAGAFFALLSGDLVRYLTDPRFLIPGTLASLSSYVLGYVPGAIQLLWTSWKPWLGNPEHELAAFQAATPTLLMRAFWIAAVLILGLNGQYFFLENPWLQGFVRPEIFLLAELVFAPAVAYFVGGAAAISAVGLGTFTHHAARVLDLRRGFILDGGKQALEPFNQLLWMLWALFALPTIASGLVSVAASGPALDVVAWAAVLMAFALLSLVVPQLRMNQLLARAKAQEIRALRAELGEAAGIADSATTSEAVRALVRHQHLLYELEEVKTFIPTLVDTRFAIQVATSMIAILLANIALRTVLAGFLP